MLKNCFAIAFVLLAATVLAIVAERPRQAAAGAPAPNPRPIRRARRSRSGSRTTIRRAIGRPRASTAGPGQLNYFALFNGDALDTNLWFLHRGVIQPKSGIGQHFHNYCEEMFVILDGEAQFTIDGRTSTLKGPAGAPARMGHSHAIYNPTDKPVQWMNINVTAFRGIYDAFDLGDGRVGAPLDPVPQFMTMQLDRRGCSRSPVCRAARGRCSTDARCRPPCSSRRGPTSTTWCCRQARRSGPARSPASAASTT